MIKLFTLSTCPWCRKTKQLLLDKGIEFTTLEVDTLAAEEQENALKEVDRLAARRSFPILVVDNRVIQGYREKEILEAIEHGE